MRNGAEMVESSSSSCADDELEGFDSDKGPGIRLPVDSYPESPDDNSLER
jgi:hypothetical protein